MAVNLSDAFSFEEKERRLSGTEAEAEGLEMKAVPPKDLLMTSAPAAAGGRRGSGPGGGDENEGAKVVNPE